MDMLDIACEIMINSRSKKVRVLVGVDRPRAG